LSAWLVNLIDVALDFLIRTVIIHTMNERQPRASISDLLRRTIADSGVSYNALQRETGVTRASIMRFVEGRQSLRLDMADRLAEFFGLALQKVR
jgi:plasmid maintenance system antidote protein VapI